MSKDTIPTFQGIDLTGIDPYLAIRASRLFDTCSMEIFRLIALLNKCKQENPATAKLVDDFTEALTDILDAHEQDVVVNNGDKISRHLYDRAMEAEKQACELNEKIHELYGQIHELEAQLLKERNSHTDAYIQSDIVNLQTQIAMLQQNAYMQGLRECIQTSSPILYADGRQCIIDQRGKFI